MTYVGAGALLDPNAAAALRGAWGYQPKMDGVYATVTTNARGEIVRICTRAGNAMPLSPFAGVRAIPHATLVGELEAITETSVAIVASRGWSLIHLFDVLSLGGMPIADAPYQTRYAQLVTEISRLETGIPTALYRGGRHRDHRGRYVDAAPLDQRRTPVVPMLRGADGCRQLWRDHVELGGGEGLVAVRLDAHASARGAKRKVKVTDTITGRVIRRDSSCASVLVRDRTIVVSAPAWVTVGALVDIAHNGFYATGEPRFARVIRTRVDIDTTSR